MQVCYKKYVVIVAVAALAFAAGRLSVGRGVVAPRVTVLTRIDTVLVRHPEVLVIKQLAERRERLALADTADSADVVVPMEQSVYRRPEFTAYVSGHKARLDSIEVFSRTVESVVVKKVKPRFSVGIQAGYGFTPHGFQPFIGVGVSFNIASF